MKGRLYVFFIRCVCRLPLTWLQRLGRFGGWFAWVIQSRSPQVARTNVQLCFPDLTAKSVSELARQNLIESGNAFTEWGSFWIKPKAEVRRQIVSVQNEDILRQALAKGQGVLLICPHMGAWELINVYCGTHYDMLATYKPAKIAPLNHLILKGRSRFGAEFVSVSNNAIKAQLKKLKQGGIVGLLPDQEPEDCLSRTEKKQERKRFEAWLKVLGDEHPEQWRLNQIQAKIQTLIDQGRIEPGAHHDYMMHSRQNKSGCFVPFFGVPAWTMTLTARLLQKTGARAVFAYCKRLGVGKGFELRFLTPPQKVYDKDVLTATTAINQGLEECILQCPEQYLWSYKRFKSRPYFYLSEYY